MLLHDLQVVQVKAGYNSAMVAEAGLVKNALTKEANFYFYLPELPF